MGAQVALAIGVEQFFGTNGLVGLALGGVGAYMTGPVHTVSRLAANVSSLLVLGQSMTFLLYQSTDHGVTFNPIASVTVLAGTRFNSASFGPTVLAQDSLLAVGVTVNGLLFSGLVVATVS